MNTLLTVVFLVGLAVTTASTWPRFRARIDARRLHRELSRANALSDAEAEWLWRIATTPRVSDPALVFLQPNLLDAAPESDREQVDAVRTKLFGD